MRRSSPAASSLLLTFASGVRRSNRVVRSPATKSPRNSSPQQASRAAGINRTSSRIPRAAMAPRTRRRAAVFMRWGPGREKFDSASSPAEVHSQDTNNRTGRQLYGTRRKNRPGHRGVGRHRQRHLPRARGGRSRDSGPLQHRGGAGATARREPDRGRKRGAAVSGRPGRSGRLHPSRGGGGVGHGGNGDPRQQRRGRRRRRESGRHLTRSMAPGYRRQPAQRLLHVPRRNSGDAEAGEVAASSTSPPTSSTPCRGEAPPTAPRRPGSSP